MRVEALENSLTSRLAFVAQLLQPVMLLNRATCLEIRICLPVRLAKGPLPKACPETTCHTRRLTLVLLILFVKGVELRPHHRFEASGARRLSLNLHFVQRVRQRRAVQWGRLRRPRYDIRVDQLARVHVLSKMV